MPTLEMLKTPEPGDWDKWTITHPDSICVPSVSPSDGAITMTMRYAGPRWYSSVRVPQEWHRSTDLHELQFHVSGTGLFTGGSLITEALSGLLVQVWRPSGTSMTVLSTQVASQASELYPCSMPLFPLRSAAGRHFIKLHSIRPPNPTNGISGNGKRKRKHGLETPNAI